MSNLKIKAIDIDRSTARNKTFYGNDQVGWYMNRQFAEQALAREGYSLVQTYRKLPM